MLEETFSHGNSIIHKADPRAKLIAALIFILITATLDSLLASATALIVSLIFLFMARLAKFKVLKRLVLVNGFIAFLWLFLPFSTPGETLFTIWKLEISLAGIELAGIITLKGNAMLLSIISLISTTPIPVLGHALSSLRVPDKFTLLLLITYRYLEVIQEECNRLTTAAKIRGFVPGTNLHTYRTYANLLAMVLIKSFERAERVYQAMLLRGFHGKFYSLQKFHFSLTDLAVSISMGICSLGLMLLDYLHWPHLLVLFQ